MSKATISKFVLAIAIVSLSLLMAAVPTHVNALRQMAVPAPSPDKSLFDEYRGVKIGMAATDVRAKIGSVKEKTVSDASDQYIFSDSESAQFFYDGNHAVNAIMITFQGDVKNAPTAKDVFGVDVTPNDQGMIFKKENYPKAGYWISYTRITGSDQMVNIALQKM